MTGRLPGGGCCATRGCAIGYAHYGPCRVMFSRGYRTYFGRCSHGEFRTFAEALECARKNRDSFVRLVNTSECDQAEDSSERRWHGLTREEWAVLEEEGFV